MQLVKTRTRSTVFLKILGGNNREKEKKPSGFGPVALVAAAPQHRHRQSAAGSEVPASAPASSPQGAPGMVSRP
jgi:hypothetical protein